MSRGSSNPPTGATSESGGLSRQKNGCSGSEGQPMFKLREIAKELEKTGRTVYHYELGDVDYGSPQPAIECAIAALRAGETHYVDPMGLGALREAIVDHYAAIMGLKLHIGQTCVGTANALIPLILEAVCKEQGKVLLPDPGFPTYTAAAKRARVKTAFYSMPDFGQQDLDMDEVEAALSDGVKAILINSPHNPTGKILPPVTVKRIFDLAARKGIYVICDEVYARLTFEDAHFSPAVYDHCQSHTIILNSFSKAYGMTGWRLGYVIGPEHLIRQVGGAVESIVSCLPPFIQRAGVEALRSGEVFLSEVVDLLKRRRDKLFSVMTSLKGVECELPGGGFYLYPRINHSALDATEYCNLLLNEEGICALPGIYFGPNGARHIRMAYSAINERNIEESYYRLARFHDRYF